MTENAYGPFREAVELQTVSKYRKDNVLSTSVM